MDPYDEFDIDTDEMYARRRPVEGRIVAVMDYRLDDRSFDLIDTRTRVLGKNDVHELIVTHEPAPAPGTTATGATYLGFVEITTGGVTIVGEEIVIGDRRVGTVAGFDLTHAPNHMNLICQSPEIRTGVEWDFECGDPVSIRRATGRRQ